MDKHVPLLICVCLVTIAWSTVRIDQSPDRFIVREPGTISCTSTRSGTTLYLYQNSTEIGRCRLNRRSCSFTNRAGRYVVLSNSTSLVLDINEIYTFDGGFWVCRDDNGFEDNLFLDVKIPVYNVTILNKEGLKFQEGRLNEVVCVTSEAIPGVRVMTWTLENSTIPSENVTTFYNSTSVLYFIPERSDNGRVLTCSADDSYGWEGFDELVINVTYGVSDIQIDDNYGKPLRDGKSVVIECDVGDSNPAPTIKWLVGSRRLPYRTNVLRYMPQKSDNGKNLTCSATNGIGEAVSDSILLDIYYTPSVLLYPPVSHYYIIPGEQVTLECKVLDSNPPVASTGYTWLKNYRTISGETLSRLKVRSTGSYRCGASNDGVFTPFTRRMLVTVLAPPRVSLSTSKLSINEGSQSVLRCSVSSNPPPSSFLWYKPNGHTQNAIQSLVISSRNQAGTYWCNATAILKSSNTSVPSVTKNDGKSVLVTVNYFDPVSISGVKQTVPEGEKVAVNCSVNSYPVALISWLRGSDVITTYKANEASLVKANVDCLFTGNYSCRAKNALFPTRTSIRTTQIYVTCSPRLDSRVSSPLKHTGNINDTVTLDFQVLSYPRPIFDWFRLIDGKELPIFNNDVYLSKETSIDAMVFRSSLRIRILNNAVYGDYVLKAQYNGQFVNIIKTALVSQSKPEPVMDLAVTNISHNSICLQWKPGFNGGSEQQFMVHYSQDNATWDVSPSIPDGTTSRSPIIHYCLPELTTETIYFIKVDSSNEYGTSRAVYVSERSVPLRTSASNTGSLLGMGTGVGIGVAVCFVIALVVAASIAIIRKCRKKQKTSEKKQEPEYYASFQSNGEDQADVRTYEGLGISHEPSEDLNIQDEGHHYVNVGRKNSIENPYVNTP